MPARRPCAKTRAVGRKLRQAIASTGSRRPSAGGGLSRRDHRSRDARGDEQPRLWHQQPRPGGGHQRHGVGCRTCVPLAGRHDSRPRYARGRNKHCLRQQRSRPGRGAERHGVGGPKEQRAPPLPLAGRHDDRPGTLETDSATTAILSRSGWVVGQGDTASGASAILWPDGTMSDLGTLGGRAGAGAAAVNDRGQIVGYSQTAAWLGHAFLWNAGGMTDLGGGGAPTTGIVATGISERVEVVGTFLWQDGTITRLGRLGGDKRDHSRRADQRGRSGRRRSRNAERLTHASLGRTAG
jgi:probable HAF family extracellular repeat protein